MRCASLQKEALIASTTAMLSTLKSTIFPDQRFPQMAAAIITGISSLVAMVRGWSLEPHFKENQFVAPQPHALEASENTDRSAVCLCRFHSIEIPFHLSIKKYHHRISALASVFKCMWWDGTNFLHCIQTT